MTSTNTPNVMNDSSDMNPAKSLGDAYGRAAEAVERGAALIREAAGNASHSPADGSMGADTDPTKGQGSATPQRGSQVVGGVAAERIVSKALRFAATEPHGDLALSADRAALIAVSALVEAGWGPRDDAFAAGRDFAAASILEHAEQHAPNEGPYVPALAALRRHLHIAARVAAGPATTEQIAEALRRGDFAVCHLDEAGRPVDSTEV